MAEAEEFSSDAVQKYLLAHNGRATNVQVVGHFAKYLNDPEFKVLNRQKFKDFINEVATVKTEKGEKYLVLRNEVLYREWIEPKHVIIRSAQPQTSKPSWPPPAPDPQPRLDPEPVAPTRKKKKSQDHGSSSQNGSSSRTSPRPTISAPIYTGPVEQVSVVNTVPGQKLIEELSQIEGVRDAKDKFEQEVRLQTPSPVKPALATAPIPPVAPVEIKVTEDVRPLESEVAMEVTDDSKENINPDSSLDATPLSTVTPPSDTPPLNRASHPNPLNAPALDLQEHEDSPSVTVARKLFESHAEKERVTSTPKQGGGRSPKKHFPDGSPRMQHHPNHDDDEHGVIGSDMTESLSSDTLRSIKSTSSGNSFPDTPKLEPLERQWMVESAKGNIPALIGLLEQEPGLAAKKDFITSALHWGAKHGKKEMIRLVAERGIDVNMKSQGGYTPLHIAAMHNKEAVMQFLVTEYHADINKRDYSGRKPRNYLPASASSYIKQLMAGLSTAEVIQPHSLMSLAEPRQEEKRHTRIGSILRSSFRSSFRLWGSAENLEGKRTPPISPPPSPKNSRAKAAHSGEYSQSLMPPPSGSRYPPSSNRSRKGRGASDKLRLDNMRKSESDPDLASDSPTITYV